LFLELIRKSNDLGLFAFLMHRAINRLRLFAHSLSLQLKLLLALLKLLASVVRVEKPLLQFVIFLLEGSNHVAGSVVLIQSMR